MLDFLKTHTQGIHREVEQKNLAKYIIDHSISLEKYYQLLVQNYFAYTTIEQALLQKKEVVREELRSFITAEKSTLLSKDIECLNTILGLKTLAKFSIDFQIQKEAEAIGAMYVMEGSMLGGLLIGKHLPKCIHLSTIENHHFFSTESKNNLQQWKKFCECVHQIPFEQTDRDIALTYAIKSFSVFDKVNTVL